jgi:hypothetical protein
MLNRLSMKAIVICMSNLPVKEIYCCAINCKDLCVS